MRIPRGARTPVLALAAALVAAGCARDIGGASVDSSKVGAAVYTQRGVVESARYVNVAEGDRLSDNIAGAAVGGAVGGLVGNQFGGGLGKAIATGVGAAAGVAAGAAAQRELSRQTAIEYVVELDDGGLVTIVQSDAQPIAPGSRVFVQTGRGQRARIIPTG